MAALPGIHKLFCGDALGYTRRLKAQDIRTALQLRDANDRSIRQQLGVVGQRIVWELRGISCLPLELCPTQAKSDGVTVLWPSNHRTERDA